MDLIIKGGRIVTMDHDRRLIDSGLIAIKGSEIIWMGTEREAGDRYTAATTIDARGRVVAPGLINTHTHIPMTLLRGIADDLDLQEWLTKYIFPAEAKNVTEEFVRTGTRLGLAEMIRGGTTTYCDMYYFEDAIADETAKAGVRAVLGQTVIDFPAPDNKTPADAINSATAFIGKWRSHPLIIPAFAPHAPYTVSRQNLQAVRKASDQTMAPVIIHLSETQEEVNNCLKQNNASPVRYLQDIGFLSDRTVAAHMVAANLEDLDILKTHHVGIAHNPQSNMKLASGIAPVPQMLEKHLAVGLGTDGAASNNDLNLWEEMDMAAKLHKVKAGDPKLISAYQAFEMATIGGARALHLDRTLGSLEPGKKADIIIIDIDGLHQTPSYSIYSTLVYTTKSSDVRTVIINGKVVMENRNLLTLDEAAVKQAANEYQHRILQSLNENGSK